MAKSPWIVWKVVAIGFAIGVAFGLSRFLIVGGDFTNLPRRIGEFIGSGIGGGLLAWLVAVIRNRLVRV